MKKDLKNSIRNLQKNEAYVGADDPTVYAESVKSKCSNSFMCVRPLLKRNTQKGITLVALVITIIVLLILAMVSIKIAIDGGLITKASKATDTHTIGAEEEAIQLGYSEYKIDLANNKPASLTVKDATTEQTADGWKVTFSGTTGNVYTINSKGEIAGPTKEEKTEDDIAMEKYALGDDLKGQSMKNVLSDSENIIFKQLNGRDVTFLNMGPFVTGGEKIDAAFYLKYNNKVYRLQLDMNGDGSNVEVWLTKSVAKVYDIPASVETIKYSYDGTKENEKDWIVLYKDETAKTAEILSPEAIGTLKLGDEDTEAQGSNDWEKAVYSYNHAIERLNNYVSSLITNPNKISVRSVGSNPSNPNYRNTTKYTSETIENWNCSLGSTGGGIGVTVNGVGEIGENNCEQDLARMSALGVASTGEKYWLASRFSDASSDYVDFLVCKVSSDGNFDNDQLFGANSNGVAPTYSYENAVRPIVKINY